MKDENLFKCIAVAFLGGLVFGFTFGIIIGVLLPSASPEKPTLYDISGSANFYNKADFGIVVHRNRLDNTVEVHVQKVKFRHLGECGMCKFKYNLNNGRYTPYDGEAVINWDNTNHLQEHERQAEQEAYERSTFDFRDNDLPDDDCPF